MIIIYIFSMKTLIVVWLRSTSFQRLYRSVTRRLFLAASKMASMDVNKCAEMLLIDTMLVDDKVCRRYGKHCTNHSINSPKLFDKECKRSSVCCNHKVMYMYHVFLLRTTTFCNNYRVFIYVINMTNALAYHCVTQKMIYQYLIYILYIALNNILRAF